jgi:hypothetical protein
VNDYFKRADSPGNIKVDPPNIIEHSHLWNGRFHLQIRVPWDRKPGDRVAVKIVVEDVQTQTRSAPFISQFTIVAEDEAEARRGGDGTGRNYGGKPGPKTSAPTLAIPEVIEKNFQEPTTSIEVRNDANGGLEYFLNLDNAFLVTELTRAKEEDKALIKHWFKYGLLLCALGMLKELKERAEGKRRSKGGNGEDGETESEGVDQLKQVSLACNGIASVIVPIIRNLYHGPRLTAA